MISMAKKKSKQKPEKKKRKLSSKQKLFSEYYMQHWNATQAAEDAGYAGTRSILAQVGYENLRKPYIAEYIEKRLAETVMGSNEVLSRLGKMARSFDMTRYIKLKERFDIITKTNKKGVEKHYKEFAGYVISFDLPLLQADGFSHLVKKVKQNSKGGIEIEWHDQQAVLMHLDNKNRPFGGGGELPEDALLVKIIGFDPDKV